MLSIQKAIGGIFSSATSEKPDKDEEANTTRQIISSGLLTDDSIIDPHAQLHREFKERHVSMIAVAGAIGTGLIIGSGTGLVRGGPASLLIACCIIGTTVYFVMTALGEMASMLPTDKGFSGYATRFVDPALGYATGWNYFFKYAIVLPNNLTAGGIIIQYWRPDLNTAIFVASFTVVIVVIDRFHVTTFGEAEFWLSTAKIPVMIMLILTCFTISLGGQPSGQRIGFAYWSHPGAFGSYLITTGLTSRFLGFWICMVQACFAYTGTEVVCVAFGEAPDPKTTVRRAVRQTLWRIVLFYIVGVLALGMSVPYTNDRLVGPTKSSTSAAASPFVIAVQLAGIEVFPDVMNGCLLIFVLSAANSDIYIGSRTLYGLAEDGQAPGLLRYTNTKGVLVVGVAVTSAFTVLGYMNVTKSSSTVFGYLVSLVTVFGTLNWINLLSSYVQFIRGMKAQGISRETMPYRGPLQPYGAYCALELTILVTFFNGEIWVYFTRQRDSGRLANKGKLLTRYNAFIPSFTVSTFMTSYIGIAVYLFNIASYKILMKSKAVELHEMDLQTERLKKDGIE